MPAQRRRARRTLLRLDPSRVSSVTVRVAAGQDVSKLDAQLAAVRDRFPRAAVTTTSFSA